jgi:flagellar hook-length control protein FliK
LQGQTPVRAASVPAAGAADGKATGEALGALHRLQMTPAGRPFLGDAARSAGATTPEAGGASPDAALNPFAAVGGDAALAAATDTKAHPGFQDLLNGQAPAPGGTDAAPPDLAAMGIAAAAAGAPAHVAGGAGQAVSGVPQYGIDAPVGTAGFATALGDRLTWMVKDGQTQAQLKLNPEQLGPIVVEIQMQGAMAHVNFVAAHDATRAAIESSMSQLASALQSEGLSLGGTNVQAQTQQHAQGRSDDASAPDTGRGASGRDTETAVSAAAPRARTARANGVLDLYA